MAGLGQSQASTRPSRTPTRSSRNDNTPTAQPRVKSEQDSDDDDDGTYKSRPQLQQGQALMRTLADLIKLMNAETINLDPEYQREVVWTPDRMTGLINSLMENFYIPPIILNRKPKHNPGVSAPQEILVYVDGKQRLSSILAFVKGLIPCNDHRGEKWWFCETVGKRRRTISEQQQRQFLQKELVSFEYNDLSAEQEEDLFARVQMGVQLNLAEKMRASTGPWQELARLFVEDFDPVYSLMKDRARSKDFQLTLSCFSQIVECMHPTAANGDPMLKTNHTHLPKLLNNKGAVDDGMKAHLASVWNTLKYLVEADPDTFTNGNRYLRGTQTFAPIEMVAVTVLISIHSETRNNKLLLGDIRAMRMAVRQDFADLRLNTTIWRWFWEYIDDLEAIRGAMDGSTVNRKTKQRNKNNDTLTGVGTVAGSTVASITAAVSAPKKGRYTARTKRSAKTVTENTPVMVKEEPGTRAVNVSGHTVAKRRRTNEPPPEASAVVEAQLPATLGPTVAMPPEGRINYSSTPSHATTRGLTHNPRLAHQGTDHAPFTANHNTYFETRLTTPAETHQQRMAAFDQLMSNHRASTVSNSNGRSKSHISREGENSLAQTAPMLSKSDNFRSSGRFTQLDGTASSKSPHEPIVFLPSSSRRPQTSLLQPSEGGPGVVIDLTDDNEQARQYLLSSFKNRPKH